MVDLLRVSVTGVNVARANMATTSHNIANVNTPSYSRQQVKQGTQIPEKYPYGYMGTGADIESITRSIDEFVMKQMRGHTSGVSQYEQLNDLTGQLSALLGDTEVGLTPDLEAFFGSMQDLADSPASIPARQVFLDQAQTLTSRTEDINRALTDLRNAVDTGITNAVTAINDLSAGIAKVNQDITLSQSAPGTQPNDLLDNRDRMLADLSELVNVHVLAQKDGSVSVFMGSGQPLVVSNNSFKLDAVKSGFDPQEITVRLEGQAEGSDLERHIISGALGGYFEFRRDILNPAQDGLGLLAMGLAETFNEQHQRGMDLNGALGENLFTAGSPKVLSHSTNDGKALFSAALNDTSGPYELSYDGTDYTLKSLPTGTVIADNFSLSGSGVFSAGGIAISIGSSGTVASGQKFLLQPDSQGTLSVPYNGVASGGIQFNARTIATTDSSQLLRSDYDIQVTGVGSRANYTNSGSATISAPTVINSQHDNLTDTVTIRFTSSGSYDVINDTTNTTLASGQIYSSGGKIPPTGDYNGWSVAITGSGTAAPQTGDIFKISAGYTVTRSSDNQEILSNGDFTALNDTMRGQGLHLSLTDTPPGSPPHYEDRFLIQPTRNGAAAFDVNLTDPRKVAAAAPITTTAWPDNASSTTISAGTVVDAKNPNLQNTVRIQFTSTSGYQIQDLVTRTTTSGSYTSGNDITYNGWQVNITGSPQASVSGATTATASGASIIASTRPTNQGTGTITAVEINDGYDIRLSNKVEIRFTSDTQYNIVDITEGKILASSGYSGSGTIAENGWKVTVSGAVKAGDIFQVKSNGDVFVIKNNQGGMGDNRNALKLVGLETEPQLMGGNDYRGVYNTLTAEVGAQGRRVESTLQSQEALLEQSTMTRESISGVNLDEEAANLVRFQQAYEASAQMMQVANSLFSTLLAAIRS